MIIKWSAQENNNTTAFMVVRTFSFFGWLIINIPAAALPLELDV